MALFLPKGWGPVLGVEVLQAVDRGNAYYLNDKLEGSSIERKEGVCILEGPFSNRPLHVGGGGPGLYSIRQGRLLYCL